MLLFHFHCDADWTASGVWQWTTARSAHLNGFAQIAVAAT
jgi:hypothetical protein